VSQKVLITGISGFIGGSLGEYFVARGARVVGLSRREFQTSYIAEVIETNYEAREVAQVVRGFRPDVIIHAAGSSSVGASLENPSEDFSKSVALLQRLLEGVRTSGIRPRIVFLSSAAVYGNPDRVPVSEDADLRPISPYGYHKSACETLMNEYALVYGMPSIVVRLFSVFGPRQRRLLIWELFDQFRNREEVVLTGSGNESRDYTHVMDLAYLVERLLSRVKDVFLILNVASGRQTSVREVAYLMKRLLNSEKPIVFQGKVRAGDPLKWQADVSRYESISNQMVATDFAARLGECLKGWSGSE
jgi:UDP-glucose 4-epimerase